MPMIAIMNADAVLLNTNSVVPGMPGVGSTCVIADDLDIKPQVKLSRHIRLSQHVKGLAGCGANDAHLDGQPQECGPKVQPSAPHAVLLPWVPAQSV